MLRRFKAWLFKEVLEAIENSKGEIMKDAQQSAADLQAGEARIEQDEQDLAAAMTASLNDLKTQVAGTMQNAGVPSDVVDAVTAKLDAQHVKFQALIAQALAADPGPVAPPANTTDAPPA